MGPPTPHTIQVMEIFANPNLLIILAVQAVVLFYLRRYADRRIHTATVALREEIAANRREMDGKCEVLNQRLKELEAEMLEKLDDANHRLDRVIEQTGILDDSRTPTECLRSVGKSTRFRRSDHR